MFHLEKQHGMSRKRFDFKLVHTFVGGMLVVRCCPTCAHNLFENITQFNFYRCTPAMMRQYNSASLKQLETRQLAPHISWAAALARGAIVATQAISLFIISIRCIPSARIAGQTRMQVPRRRRVGRRVGQYYKR
jgi:hypothetical protein